MDPEERFRVEERGHRDDSQRDFEHAPAATGTGQAPWYVIPAD